MPVRFSVPAHLLPAAADLRGKLGAAPHDQGADALGPADLVRRDQRHPRARPVEGERQLAEALGHVRHRQPLGEVLNHAGLGDAPLRIDGEAFVDPGAHRVMLDPRALQPAPGQRQRRGLGGARGEDDIGPVGAKRRGELGARALDQRLGAPTLGMDR